MKYVHHIHTLKHKETLSLTLLIQQWCDAVLLGFDFYPVSSLRSKCFKSELYLVQMIWIWRNFCSMDPFQCMAVILPKGPTLEWEFLYVLSTWSWK